MPGMYLLAVRTPLDSDPRGPTETLLESRVPKPVLGQAEEEKVKLHGLLASVLHSICCRSGGSLYSTMQTSKVIRLHGRLVFPRLDYPIAKSRETVPAQPVDATLSNRLIQHYFLQGTGLYGCTQSEPKQGSVLFASTPLSEF